MKRISLLNSLLFTLVLCIAGPASSAIKFASLVDDPLVIVAYAPGDPRAATEAFYRALNTLEIGAVVRKEDSWVIVTDYVEGPGVVPKYPSLTKSSTRYQTAIDIRNHGSEGVDVKIVIWLQSPSANPGDKRDWYDVSTDHPQVVRNLQMRLLQEFERALTTPKDN